MLPYNEMIQLDRLIHEPARLAIMSCLKSYSMLEFLLLGELINLTYGNLSSHLSKLEKAGYVHIEKSFIQKKKAQTSVRITPQGLHALNKYWKQIDYIRSEIERIEHS
ncbi:transcriptional regulator [Thermoactinomyces sp. DSM 45892]|uniref:transcriptional regulator n=1 Tax=Thermoactinomyces sp. DSM 45892 TaxID=1882753 RepID=UPI00089499EA|nr:transcriptional regulator [Thermoactinomyces sp. DSM 45892]SDY84957.1 transcriptional regulator [Thermoactinomyces sp. DSM 45892]